MKAGRPSFFAAGRSGLWTAEARAGLIPKKVQVTQPKTGKTFTMTVYVRPEVAKAVAKNPVAGAVVAVKVANTAPPPRPADKAGDKPDKPAAKSGPADAADPHADWVKSPGTGKRDRWVNQETGDVRYGKRPRERSPEEKGQAEAARQARLAKPAREDDLSGDVAGARKAMLGPENKGFGPLVGNPAGSVVRVSESKAWDGKPRVRLSIDHPDTKPHMWERTVTANPDGTLHVHNDLFFLKPRYQGSGFGMKAFTAQVREGFGQGVDAISTLAGKGNLGPGNKMGGYYVWARLGYDAPLTRDYQKRLPEGFKDAKTVQDLMASPGGAEHWKKTGYMTEMRFDLSPGSKSVAALNAYLAKKGEPPVDTGPDAAKAREQAIAARKERVGKQEPPKESVRPTPEQIHALHITWSHNLHPTGLYEQVRPKVEADMAHWIPRDALPVSQGGQDMSYERATNNLYRYWTDHAAKERWTKQWLAPEADRAHAEWEAEAGKAGINPVDLANKARQVGLGYVPDAWSSVDGAYRAAFVTLRRERAAAG